MITEMMNRHLIIDIDHMSLRSVNDTFYLTWKSRLNNVYPVIAGHTGPLGTAITTDRKNENAKSDNELSYLYQYGGLIGVGLGGTTTGTRGYTTTFSGWRVSVPNDCSNSSKSWAQNYLYTVDHLGGPEHAAVAFASDQPLNPFLGPRLGYMGNDTPVTNEVIRGCGNVISEQQKQAAATMVKYPIPIVVNRTGYAPSAPVQLWQSKLGNRAWDFNLDGMAHIGMYPDLLQDVSNLGLTPRDLAPAYRSAEQYIEMWERAEGTFNTGESSTIPPASTTPNTTVRSIRNVTVSPVTPTVMARTPVMSPATVAPLARPDLSVVVGDVHLSNTAPHLGQSVTFTALVHNTGAAARLCSGFTPMASK